MGLAYDSLGKSVERLASGLRINSAKDDAAGLAVRELFRADVAVLQQGSRNAQDGISMMQTMEGAMAVIDGNLIRMKELAEQAATGSYSEAQREIMNSEFAEMAAEIERIADVTEFNGIKMLNSSTGDVKIHVGGATTIDIDNVDMTNAGLNIETGEGQWDLTSTTVASAGGNTYGGVTSADATILTVQTGAGSTGDLVLDLQFGSEEIIDDVTFATSTAGGSAVEYSLQDIADAFNTESQNPTVMYDENGNRLGYNVAEVVELHDGTYGISFNARTRTPQSMTFAIDSSSGAVGTLTGVFGAVETGGAGGNIMIGAELWERYDETAEDWVQDTTGGAGAGLNILTVDAATDALATVTAAINTKVEARANFGYKMNRLEGTISVLDIQTENMMAAESRISDVDVATEMSEMTRNQVLSQAGISMLAQANSMPTMALTLLR